MLSSWMTSIIQIVWYYHISNKTSSRTCLDHSEQTPVLACLFLGSRLAGHIPFITYQILNSFNEVVTFPWLHSAHVETNNSLIAWVHIAWFKHKQFSFRLCLVPGKYKGKKKNVKENDFLMFGYSIKYSKEN